MIAVIGIVAILLAAAWLEDHDAPSAQLAGDAILFALCFASVLLEHKRRSEDE